MLMNLVIDVGNTFVKSAVFNGNMLSKTSYRKSQFVSNINKTKKMYPSIDRCIISSVGNLTAKQIIWLKCHYSVLELTSQTKVPFINSYGTPKTLGVDRMALASGAVAYYPGKNTLVIDAGTCITYDFIDKFKTYHGGAISPGIRMRYKALHGQTAKLPLLETKVPKTIIGDSTESSIHSGVIFGISYEMDGVIDQYRLKYPDLTVILTGGDAKLLSNQLKNSIFANSNFLLLGLNVILDYNS